MDIVSASVHDTHIFTKISCPYGGLEWKIGVLCNWEGIHVSSYAHNGAWLAALQKPNNTCVGDPGRHFHP